MDRVVSANMDNKNILQFLAIPAQNLTVLPEIIINRERHFKGPLG